MFMPSKLSASFRQILGAGLGALGLGGAAEAQVYAFNTFLSGGGGGQDPQKKRLARAAVATAPISAAKLRRAEVHC